MRGIVLASSILFVLSCSPDIPDYSIPEIPPVEQTIPETTIPETIPETTIETPVIETPIIEETIIPKNEYLGNGLFNLVDDTILNFIIKIDNKIYNVNPELIKVYGDIQYYIDKNENVINFPFKYQKYSIQGPGLFQFYASGTDSSWVAGKSPGNFILRITIKCSTENMFFNGGEKADYILLSRSVIIPRHGYPCTLITTLNGEEVAVNI
jgi:hypothetical protein